MSETVIESTQLPELLTVDQFAQLLKVSRTTVFSWLKTGEILEGVHYMRLGKILRFRSQIESLFRKTKQSSTKLAPKQRTTPLERKKPPSSGTAVNLDYGALTV